jgi:hypothetical protein
MPEDLTADPKENMLMTLLVTVPPHSHISVALKKYACSFCSLPVMCTRTGSAEFCVCVQISRE